MALLKRVYRFKNGEQKSVALFYDRARLVKEEDGELLERRRGV